MLKTLAIDELEVGMFVQDIKLKNNNHKVKNQGKVNSSRTIELLKKQGAVSVVVKLFPDEKNKETPTELTSTSAHQQAANAVSISDEFAQSCQVYDQATENVKALFNQVSKGEKLTTDKILVLADEITESVFRNEYAITILTRIREQANYHWEHAVNTAILICGFGLYLGLKKETVKQITLGALFHDIGLARVPSGILKKPGKLTENEKSVVQKHVKWGLEIGKRDNMLSDIVIDMMVNHHERLDGTGYPRGLKENKLSKLARITAIIDVYDAMTGDRDYKKGLPPGAALRHLLSSKDKFDPSLVQQFIKFLGVHPVGSLVQLSNDKLAIVIEGNRKNPLKPVTKLIYSTKLNALITPKTHDLRNEDTQIVGAVRGEDFHINLPKLIRSVSL